MLASQTRNQISNPTTHKAKERLWLLGDLKRRTWRTLHRQEWQIDICSGTPDKCIDHRRIYGTNNNNWGNLLADLFTENNGSEYSQGFLVKANATKTTYVTAMAGTAYDSFNNNSATAGAQDYYAWVELGTGTGSPARSDYDLFTPASATSTPKVTASFTAGGSQITLSATASYGSAISPTEVGLFLHFWENTTPGMNDMLFDHTTFSALASNTAFTVTYSIALG